MSIVGIKKLKDNLSNYIKEVQTGETVIITDRGKCVAYLSSIKEDVIMEDLMPLIKEGLISWKGGKPAGNPAPPVIMGKSTSDIILENRE